MNNTIQYLKKNILDKPDICIILGSGLNSFVNEINNKSIVNYRDIPGLSNTNVEGHEGKLIIGKINQSTIMCANGRSHYYEGHSFEKVAKIIKIFSYFNPKLCIITNSSGCLNLNWKLGSLMLANQFIDYSYIKTSNPEFHKPKNNKYLNKLLEVAKKNNIKINQGAYTFTTGPIYETATEINDIIKLGGKAVGMSTFPEFLKCEELNIDNLIISCLTNYGAGLITNKKIEHNDVLTNANKFKNNFNKLLIKFIENM